MSGLAAFLSVRNIVLNVRGSSSAGFLAAVAAAIDVGPGLPPTRISAALQEREQLASTGLGRGVAVPHARISGLLQVVAAFARPELPVEFGAPDGKPVTDAVILLVPEHSTEQHLQLLAEVAALFSDRSFRARLRELDDAAAIWRLFDAWSVNLHQH